MGLWKFGRGRTPFSRGDNMDFRRFGAFVIIIGLVIAAYGVVQIATNQPVKAKRSEGGGIAEAFNEMGTAITSLAENADREHTRKTAVKIIFAGGVVALVGVGMKVSAKPPAQ